MPDENRLPLLHPSSLTLHSDASPPSNPTTSPTVDTPTNKTQPASLHSYRLPSSSSLVPAASYTVYQPPPSTFHTSQPRPPPLLLIPSTPSSHSSTSSHAFPHPPPPLATPLTAIPMALDTILVRTAHRFSWSSFHHQYLFPLTVPTFASPHLPSYVSPSEWSTSIHHLNSALRWPLRVQLARLLLSLLTLLAFCAIWSHEVRERRTYTIACWVGLIGAGLSLVVLTKVYGQRVRRRLEAAVEAENRYYEGRGGVMSTQGGGAGVGVGGGTTGWRAVGGWTRRTWWCRRRRWGHSRTTARSPSRAHSSRHRRTTTNIARRTALGRSHCTLPWSTSNPNHHTPAPHVRDRSLESRTRSQHPLHKR